MCDCCRNLKLKSIHEQQNGGSLNTFYDKSKLSKLSELEELTATPSHMELYGRQLKNMSLFGGNNIIHTNYIFINNISSTKRRSAYFNSHFIICYFR